MITRRKQFKPFAPIGTDVIYHGNLTPEELGIYVAMAAKPDSWEFNEQVMARELQVSQEEIHRLLLKLERKGYTRSRTGRYGLTWDFFESPCPVILPNVQPKREAPQEQPKPEAPKIPGPKQEEGEEKLTHEEMAQKFFDLAKELAKKRDLNRAIRV